MTFQLPIKARDIKAVKALLEKHKANEMIWWRVDNNLAAQKPKITKEKFWWGMISMMSTSQQRSNPEGAVYRLIYRKPYPLAYRLMSQQKDIQGFVVQVLKEHGGIRYSGGIGRNLAKNFHFLEEAGGWNETLKQVNRLTSLQSKEVEREIARYLSDNLLGLGSKQARNTLQFLGLTRFEIPIDSRVTNWLCANTSFPEGILNAGNLSSPVGYEFVLDQIQNLCEACNEFPCIVDAAVFSDLDGDAWGTRPNAEQNWPRPKP